MSATFQVPLITTSLNIITLSEIIFELFPISVPLFIVPPINLKVEDLGNFICPPFRSKSLRII